MAHRHRLEPAGHGARQRPALHVARRNPDGELVSAGAVQLGLHSDAATPLHALLDTIPPSGRPARRLAVPPGIAVQVDFHGPPGGVLRDAVLRAVQFDPRAITATSVAGVRAFLALNGGF
jgi:hypothetical protein